MTLNTEMYHNQIFYLVKIFAESCIDCFAVNETWFVLNPEILVVDLHLFCYDEHRLNPCLAVHGICRIRHYPQWLLFAAFVISMGCPRSNLQKTSEQWCRPDWRYHWLWGWFPNLKNNFYDVIRLKIMENRYFPKETVKVGFEKQPRCQTIERDKITVNL